MIDPDRIRSFLREDMAAGAKDIQDDRFVRIASVLATVFLVSFFLEIQWIAFILAACCFGELVNSVCTRVSVHSFSLKLYAVWALNNLLYTSAFCSLVMPLIIHPSPTAVILGLIVLVGSISQPLVVGVNSVALSYLCLAAPLTFGWTVALHFISDIRLEWGVVAGLTILTLHLVLVTHKSRSVMRARNDARARADEEAEAKRRFIVAISHEIRTPLNGIQGIADLQRASAVTDTEIQQADLLVSTSESLRHLLDDVLDQAKIEAGQMQLTFVPGDMRTVVRQTVALFQANAQHKHLDLRYEFPPDDVPLILKMDRLRMGQILSNLISNAIKFTDLGSVVVKTRIDLETKDAAMLDVRVSDSGRGMTHEETAMLFQDFTQVGDQQDRATSGTGLGLAISRGLARAMGGDLTVRSEIGKGSEFVLRVPCTRVVASDLQTADPPDGAPDLTGWRIIAADDNATNRFVLEKFLNETNATFTAVPGGAEAIAAMTAQNQDLLLLDIKMPGMDGLTVFDEMQNLPAHILRPKVVALTAHTKEDARRSYLRIGMDGYLAKPLRKNILFSELARLGIKAPKPNPVKI